MSDNEIPMIPKHQAESQMMHMSRTNRWLVIAIIIGFIGMVLQAYIFVSSYTSRTERWLKTYNDLVNRYAVTEVADEKEKTGIVQQSPFP